MAIELVSLPLPATADASKFADFGREVRGVDPGSLNSEQFEEVRKALYKVCLSRRYGIISQTIDFSTTHSYSEMYLCLQSSNTL
jgi:hypothetical protein